MPTSEKSAALRAPSKQEPYVRSGGGRTACLLDKRPPNLILPKASLDASAEDRGWAEIIFAPQALAESSRSSILAHTIRRQRSIRDYWIPRGSWRVFQSLELHTGSVRIFDGSCADRITSTIVLCARSS